MLTTAFYIGAAFLFLVSMGLRSFDDPDLESSIFSLSCDLKHRWCRVVAKLAIIIGTVLFCLATGTAIGDHLAGIVMGIILSYIILTFGYLMLLLICSFVVIFFEWLFK